MDATGEDTAWLHYLMHEARAYGAGLVPHESDRLRIIRAQIDEMRRGQAAGLLPDDVDPGLPRLFAFALAR